MCRQMARGKPQLLFSQKKILDLQEYIRMIIFANEIMKKRIRYAKDF